MYKNKFLIFSIFLLFILSVSMVSANENITDGSLQDSSYDGDIVASVENSGNNQDLSASSSEGSFKDLQKIVSDAKDGDTIKLEKDYCYSNGDPKKGVAVKKSLTIDGNGHELDGVSASRMFVLGDKDSRITVNLKNIKFINGHAQNGGVIIIAHSTKKINLNIDNCTFENNRAESSGGAIYIYDNDDTGGVRVNSYLTITNSKFIKNEADYAGAIYSQGISTTIDNSVFKNNKATSGSGGALDIADDQSLSLTNSIFDSNEALDYAGAIEYFSSEPMIVSKCNFTGNSAKFGGAIMLSCYYKKCKITDCVFKSNTAKTSGGAISSDSSYVLKNNIFENNNLPELEIKYKEYFSPVYKSGKNFEVKIVNTLNQQPIKGVKITLYVKYSNGGKKYKTKTMTAVTNNKGVAVFKVSKLSQYFYYGEFKLSKSFKFVDNKLEKQYGRFVDFISFNNEECNVFEISKAHVKVKAPKITAKHKKSKYFNVKITSSKKPLKQTKIKLKIFTGKKAKTYTVKTNKNGVAKFNTNKLTKGSHKVLISSANKLLNYKINSESKIKIR